MSVHCGYQFGAEILTLDDARVGSVEVAAPDWGPALQWSHFQRLRSGGGPWLMHCAEGRVEPCWDAEAGRPFVSALRVFAGDNGTAEEIPTRYLRDAVERAAASLVTDGKLEQGQSFRFRLFALEPERVASGQTNGAAEDFERIADPLPVETMSYAAVRSEAITHDATYADPVDLPVVIPSTVLDDATAQASAAGDVETGAVLVGHVCRDPDSGELFLLVTAGLPARHTIATGERLTFTARTWADAQATLGLRGRGEMFVGWLHSHPFWCRKCSAEAQAKCALSSPFLSAHDCALHRTIFGRAFDIAVLVSDGGPRGYEHAVFGWRRGLIVRRGYAVSRTQGAREAAVLVADEETVHAGGEPGRAGGRRGDSGTDDPGACAEEAAVVTPAGSACGGDDDVAAE